MKGRIACLAAWVFALAAPPANASPVGVTPSPTLDPLGDLIAATLMGSLRGPADYYLRATLYHAGERGIRALDSLGCKVVAMRTAAVDGVQIPRRTILFIKETVGLPMPDGSKHNGFWYASDVGASIHTGRIDLFTGRGVASMGPLMALNLSKLTVMRAGAFAGCPPA
jgi:3D (Asp-Asp-Asp) domain-containing protein